ncbi:MAG TPA: hypothetical protein VGF55_17610 [Gemmataceae bacterium]|jgi:hypothetical protein
MVRVLGVLLLLAAGVAALGYYMDWFHVSTGGTKGAVPMTVGVTIDQDKIKADAEAAKEKARSLGSKAQQAVTPESPKR